MPPERSRRPQSGIVVLLGVAWRGSGEAWGVTASRTGTRTLLIAVCAGAVVAGLAVGTAAARPDLEPQARSTPLTLPLSTPSPQSGLQPSGRQLTPAGDAGRPRQLPHRGRRHGRRSVPLDRLRRLRHQRRPHRRHWPPREVCQPILDLPGASGGIALDSARRLAYVSGLPNSRWQPTKDVLPGARGDVVLVYSLDRRLRPGARRPHHPASRRTPDPPLTQSFPPPRAGLAASTSTWPQKLAVSPDGGRLLVPLNLADQRAVVDLGSATPCAIVSAGSYPFGAAILPDGALGLVSNEAIRDAVGRRPARRRASSRTSPSVPPLSHPQGIVVDRAGTRAYVALSAMRPGRRRRPADAARRAHDLGRAQRRARAPMPVAVALSPDGRPPVRGRVGRRRDRRHRACPASSPRRRSTGRSWAASRRPTTRRPWSPPRPEGGRPAQLLYVAARGLGVGPNPTGPDPTPPRPDLLGLQPDRPHAPTSSAASGYTGRRWSAAAPGSCRCPTDARGRAPHSRRGTPAPAGGRAGARRGTRRCAPTGRSSTSSSSCARTAATTSSWATSAAATATPS